MPSKKGKYLPLPAEEIIQDYRLAYRSRQVSLVGRREVLSGKAKFGIFGAGKEVAQIALARAFNPGDCRRAEGISHRQLFMERRGPADPQGDQYRHGDLAWQGRVDRAGDQGG